MILLKILKRRDASSAVVAILMALIVSQPLSTITAPWAGKISGLKEGQYASYASPGSGWKGQYLYPLLWALLQLIVLEILGWLYVWSAVLVKRK